MTTALAPSTGSTTTTGAAPTRVMVVDDSVVIRGLTARWLEEAGYTVVATAANGRVAVEQIERARPDIILLDIEMPEMDGITALPLLLAKSPRVSVIVISTLTQRNAHVSLKCLSLGAVDYLAKPESHRGVSTSMTFRADLLVKVKVLSERHRPAPSSATASATASAGTPFRRTGVPAPGPSEPPARTFRAPLASTAARTPAAPAVLRPRPASIAKRLLVVGASTGGPRAVGEFLSAVGPALKSVPICIVQHMPPIFTAVFAEHLGTQTGLQAAEGSDGDILQPGRIYVAPGGRHMGLRRDKGGIVIRLDDGPPVNFCKPAVDVLFNDTASLFGASTLAVVLTGMGSDGTHGARAIGEAGGVILVQDEATSTVWGMPGSIAKAGFAHDVLPLQAMAPAVKKFLNGSAT
jgi:two-component system, chemotaxis family, protein-glutamate methylesterase/glutaminase